MTRCVGAFLRPCFNATDRILCDECYALVDKLLSPTRGRNRVANVTRPVYRRRAKVAA